MATTASSTSVFFHKNVFKNTIRFRNEDEDDGSDMVASLDQIRREDARARRIARLEDAREEREEQYRLERKRLKK